MKKLVPQMANNQWQMANNYRNLKVAIVCDWLTNMGGAERVVLQLHKMFPEAPIYTSSYAPDKMPLFKGADIRTGLIQKLPFSHKHQLWPVLRRRYFGNLKLTDYDLIISSSGAEAKAINMGISGAKKPAHIAYIHTPTQYYWVRPEEYLSAKTAGGLGVLDPVWRLGLRILKPSMKRWDYLAAQNPDLLIANSGAVARRIKKFYNRDSSVIWPPVEVEKFKPKSFKTKRRGFVIAGRQVHHKRFDLAVRACSELGLELRVIGGGPEHERLKSMAGKSVKFLGRVSDSELIRQLQNAEALIFPQEDDFGIVAVEAMAAGAPVIAYRAGGALDTVAEGKTGLFFDTQNTAELKRALKDFSKKTWDEEAISAHAGKFSAAKFKESIYRIIGDAI